MPNLLKLSSVPEVPGTMVRIGRGMNDLIEPLQQLYYDVSGSAKAAPFRQQREEEEALYQRGLQGDPDPNRDADLFRVLGRSVPLMAFPGYAATTPEAAMGQMGTVESMVAWDRFQKWLADRTQQASGAIEAMR